MGTYGLNFYAWPPLAAGVSIFILGLVMVFREKCSSLGRAFLLLTTCSAGWLFSFFFVYLAGDIHTALFWLRTANSFVVFIPSIFYFFVLTAARRLSKRTVEIFLAFLVSEIFLVCIWGGSSFLMGARYYFWGYYSHYGPATYFFLVFFFGAMAASFRMLWMCHHKYKANTKRFKTFLVGFAIAYLGSVDYLAAYGVPLYPFGYLAVLIFCCFMARGILRKHFMDITPSFAAEQILKTMADGLLVLDREGIVRLANESAQHLFSEDGSDLLGQKISASGLDFFKKQNLARLLWTGGVQNHEINYFTKAHGMHTLDISTSVIRDNRKDPVAVICIIKDISSRKGAELALMESEKHYRILAENVTDVIWTLDMNLKLTYISPSVVKLTGFSTGEALAMDLEKTFLPVSAKNALSAFTALFNSSSQPSSSLELEYYCKDGSTIWAEVTLSVIRNSKGNVAEILGVSRNIREHRKVRESLKMAESLYHELAASVSDPVFILDRNCVIKSINPAAEQVLGFHLAELAGKNLAKCGIFAPEAEAKALQEVTCVFLGWQRLCFDAVFVRRDKTRCMMEAYPKLMRKDSEQPFVQILFKNLRELTGQAQDQNVA